MTSTTTISQWQSGQLANPFTRRFDGVLDVRAKKEMKKLILHSFSTVQKAMGQRHTSKITLRLQEIGLDAVNNHVSGRCYIGTTFSVYTLSCTNLSCSRCSLCSRCFSHCFSHCSLVRTFFPTRSTCPSSSNAPTTPPYYQGPNLPWAATG